MTCRQPLALRRPLPRCPVVSRPCAAASRACPSTSLDLSHGSGRSGGTAPCEMDADRERTKARVR
eukprot:1818412-Prymnesium_polylepis.1